MKSALLHLLCLTGLNSIFDTASTKGFPCVEAPL